MPGVILLENRWITFFSVTFCFCLARCQWRSQLGLNMCSRVSGWCHLLSEPGHSFVDLTLVNAPGNAWRRSSTQRTEDVDVSSALFGYHRFCPRRGKIKTRGTLSCQLKAGLASVGRVATCSTMTRRNETRVSCCNELPSKMDRFQLFKIRTYSYCVYVSFE